MEHSSMLAQAAELVKAGQKQAAANLLRQLIQAEPGNAQAWGLMAMALDDPEKRRQCLQEVMHIGDERMAAWAHHQLAALPPAPPPPQMEVEKPSAPPLIQAAPLPSPQVEVEKPAEVPPIQAVEPPPQINFKIPAEPPPGRPERSARPYLIAGAAILAVACLLLVMTLLLPTIQRYVTVAAQLGQQLPAAAPTSTVRPTRVPKSSTLEPSNTPLPTRTRVPKATSTPTATVTPTPGPTGTLTAVEIQMAAALDDYDHVRFDAAIQGFTRALALDPKLVSAYVGRGFAYAALGKIPQAEVDAAAAIKLDANNVDANILTGTLARQRKEYQAALDIFAQIISDHPDNARAYRGRGIVYQDMGNIDAALDDLEKSMQIRPDYTGAITDHANILYDLHNYAAACPEYKLTTELEPDMAIFFSNYGNCLLWGYRDLDGASENYEKSLVLDPNLDSAHFGRGHVLYFSGKYNEALTEYNVADRLGIIRAGLYQQRGLTYTHLENYQAAVSDFTNLLKYIPHDPCAYNNRCQAYNGVGNYTAAIADCTVSIQGGGPADAIFNRAVAYDETGQVGKALQDYQQYVQYVSPDTESAKYAQDRIKALGGGVLVGVVCTQMQAGSCGSASVVADPTGDQLTFPHVVCEPH